jgi:hypothetical protein
MLCRETSGWRVGREVPPDQRSRSKSGRWSRVLDFANLDTPNAERGAAPASVYRGMFSANPWLSASGRQPGPGEHSWGTQVHDSYPAPDPKRRAGRNFTNAAISRTDLGLKVKYDGAISLARRING